MSVRLGAVLVPGFHLASGLPLIAIQRWRSEIITGTTSNRHAGSPASSAVQLADFAGVDSSSIQCEGCSGLAQTNVSSSTPYSTGSVLVNKLTDVRLYHWAHRVDIAP